MKPNILYLHLMNIKTQNKNNISYNDTQIYLGFLIFIYKTKL
jgi:hypothetical protein